MAKFDHQSICDAIYELAAALTRAGNCAELPGKLVAFTESPNLSCQAVGLKVVADLVEIAKGFPSSFTTYLANFIQALFAIAKTSEAKDGVRQMAVEVLLCIIEDDDDMQQYLSNQEFVSELVPILVEFEVDDNDLVDPEYPIIELEATKNDWIGVNGLERLYKAMEDKEVVNVILVYVSQYLRKDGWLYKMVAIKMISYTIDYLPDEGLEMILDEIVELLKAGLNNQHPHARVNGCKALNQITLAYHYNFQMHYAKEFFPLLVNLLDDPSSRVQFEAAAVFIDFAKETEKADLMPFADQFMERLLEGIKPEKPRMMREQCVKGITVVASVIKKKFMKYYSLVIPVMKGIIVASTTRKERTMRKNAVECISKISSVGVEMLQADAHEVMQALLHIVGAGVEADDPIKKYIQKVFSQMCRSLKGEFVPYLPHLIPNVLQVLNVESQFVSIDEDCATKVSFNDEKARWLKTSMIKEINQAVDLLSTFIEVLGAQLGEYLVPTAESLLSLLAFKWSRDMMGSILTAVAKVFSAARELSSSDPVAARQRLSLWVGKVLEKVFRDITLDYNYFSMLAKMRGLSKCLHNAGPGVLSAQQIGTIYKSVFTMLKLPSYSPAKIASCKPNPNEKLIGTLLKIIGVVMLFHTDLYLQTGAELFRNFFGPKKDPNCNFDDRKLALAVADDLVEHYNDKRALLWQRICFVFKRINRRSRY